MGVGVGLVIGGFFLGVVGDLLGYEIVFVVVVFVLDVVLWFVFGWYVLVVYDGVSEVYLVESVWLIDCFLYVVFGLFCWYVMFGNFLVEILLDVVFF